MTQLAQSRDALQVKFEDDPESPNHQLAQSRDALQVKFEDEPESPKYHTNKFVAPTRDAALHKVHQDETIAAIKAWEQSRKAKAINRCEAKIMRIRAEEAAKVAAAESRLKQSEEKLVSKRAGLVERMRNEIATTHKIAEEKRALAEAKKGEMIFKIEENAARFRASNTKPGDSGFLCFNA